MKTLVLVEHEGGKVKDATLAAVMLDPSGRGASALAGQSVGGVAEAAAKIAGVGKVHVADDAAYGAEPRREGRAAGRRLDGRSRRFLAPATTTGKNVAPRVAACST